jgi:hypothetical protein
MILRYIGCVLVFSGGWMLIQRITARGKATGTVVGHEKRCPMTSADIATIAPTPLFHAVIEFVDGRGHPHRFTSAGGDTEPRLRHGTRLSVRYRPGNPDDAFITTFAQMWVMPMVWLAAGAAALWLAWQG